MAATKEQERKALEKIKKIVDELGPDSYVGTAFRGCFEDAEQNINNDFACSMKERYEVWFARAGELEDESKALKKELVKAKDRADEAEKRYNELKAQQLSFDDLDDFEQMLSDSCYECEKNIEQAAQLIVEYAVTPTDIAFQNAVNRHRAYQKKLEYMRELKTRVNRAKGNN